MENLLVVDNDGRIISCRVSYIYGRALFGAIAMQSGNIHDSSLSQTESLSLEKIKRAAQAVAPGDNIMFINDNRRIRSCRINPKYGIALLEYLRQNPQEVADVAKAALSYDPAIQSSEASSSSQETRAESSQRPSKKSKPSYTNPSFSAVSTSATPTTKASILSDHILSTVNRQPYNRDWMSKYNINDSCLNGPSSKVKLDVLVKNGAIKAGDLLCVRYDRDDGNENVEVGEVSRCDYVPTSHIRSNKMLILTSLSSQVLPIPPNAPYPQNSQLDLHVLTHQASIDGILHDCKGATDIVNGMDRESTRTNGKSKKLPEPWKTIGVLERDGREVGSLWKVRQAYEVFTEAVREWGERNNEVSD